MLVKRWTPPSIAFGAHTDTEENGYACIAVVNYSFPENSEKRKGNKRKLRVTPTTVSEFTIADL